MPSKTETTLWEWHRRMENIDFILSSSTVEDSFGAGAMFEFRALRNEFLRLKEIEGEHV